MTNTIRVMIVDDSRTARMALRHSLESDPGIKVVGEAATGEEAFSLAARCQPDIVTMDVFLRREDGIEVTARLMEVAPVPVVIVTGVNPRDPGLAFRAVQAGAMEVLAKLPAQADPGYDRALRRLLRTIKSLAQVPVVTKRSRARPRPAETAPAIEPVGGASYKTVASTCICIGASTGGPPLLDALIQQIDVPARLPIAIVQHISQGFAEGMARWLASESGHKVQVVEHDMAFQAGTIYLAGDTRHLVLKSPQVIGPSDDPPIGFHKPAIDKLFVSAAEHFGGAAVAILLTGMGKDGVAGLKQARASGALTIAQEPGSCTVDSMPRSAIEGGAAIEIMDPAALAAYLRRVC